MTQKLHNRVLTGVCGSAVMKPAQHIRDHVTAQEEHS